MNILNGVPIPQALQTQPNMPPNPNMTPMGMQVFDPRNQPNADTSN